MRRAMLGVTIMGLALAVSGSVFERFLSPDRPSDRAIINYLELAKSGRASSMDLANLGVLILEKGFPGDAEDYLLAALKLDKHNYEAAYRLGLVLQREGRDREATRYYKKTLKERPGYAQARFMLALAEERCGKREAAIHDYAKAYRYAPELANPLKNPLVYDSGLQAEAALRHYEEAVRTSTLKVTEIDPAAIRRMMEASPNPRPQPGPAEVGSQVAPEKPHPQPGGPSAPTAAPAGSAAPVTATPPAAQEGRPQLDVRTAPQRVQPRPFRAPRPVEATPTPQPSSVEPTPTPEPESEEPAPKPEPDSTEPAPNPEPGSEEPKPTATPTR